MTPTGTQLAEIDANAGVAAEERRLDLLRQIAQAGGKVDPVAEPLAKHGYTYVACGDDIERDLGILARHDYLEERFFDRVSLCPKCDGHHLNVREICPGCRRAHLVNEGLLHHSPVEAVCLACGTRTSAEDLISAEVFSYVLTSRGALAIRRGSLLDGNDEPVSIADAPVYRRTVILEFLEQEMKRLQHFNSAFSVLLVNCSPSAVEQRGDDSPTQWLTRLRDCLREVDVIGQLADTVYVVILPQTKRRPAETLRQRILADLGPQSPLTVAAVEVTEPRHLAQVVAGRNKLVRSA